MFKSLMVAGVAAAALMAVPAAASAQSYGYQPRNTACERQTADNKVAGTMVGALLGAVAGGAIGNNTGDDDSRWHRTGGYGRHGRHGRWEQGNNDGEVIAGALIGAIVGGVAGNAIASDSGPPCQVATPYGGTFRSTYPAAYQPDSIPRTTDGLYGSPNDYSTHPQSSYPNTPPPPRTYPASSGPAYPQTQYPADTSASEECRTIYRETQLPDGRVEREPVTACRDGYNGDWEIVDGNDDELYGY